ncbi:MAG: hypothetical protein ABIB43_03745 [archaeon]
MIHRNNQEIVVRVLYGERENALIKMQEATFQFKTGGGTDIILYIL